MSLSINQGIKLPPAYNGNPETISGTVFAVGEAQSTKYIPGHTGSPIPDCWDDGNPKMQIILYVVGSSGKAVRIFVGKSNKEGSVWEAWVNAVKELSSESFEILLGNTFQIHCKITYKPGGKEVAFREWDTALIAGQDYRPNLDDEWKNLPQGVLPTFYYPGYSPEERANTTPVAAPPVATVPVAQAAPTQTQLVSGVDIRVVDTETGEIYEDIPF